MQISVIAYLATYGNSPLLCHALSQLGHDVELLICKHDIYKFHEEYPNTKIVKQVTSEMIEKSDFIILVALPVWQFLLSPEAKDIVKTKSGVYILSGSHTLRNPAETQQIILESGLKLFVMPDLIKYLGNIESQMYLPPMNIPPKIKKTKGGIIIGHSPGKSTRLLWKGTRSIESALNKVNGRKIITKIIMGLTHQAAIIERSKCHIFIDQIHKPSVVCNASYPRYVGGLGKSGLEAMASGCVVIHSGKQSYIDPKYPASTVIANSKNLVGVLKKTISSYTPRQADVSRKWVINWCSPKKVATRLLEQ